jgi:type IV pilus assembly protein PilA
MITGTTARYLLLAAVVVSANAVAQSQVPNTFEAGQPARAAEVNENFESLDQRIQQLETAPSPVTEQVSTAIPLASETRFLFAEYHQFRGSFPADNDAAGALLPADIQNDFVSSVAITGDKVVVTFDNNADASIQNDALEFISNITGDGIYFTCNPTGGVVAVFDSDSCIIADEPPEPLTTIRKQVASAIPIASEPRWMVVDYYEHVGVFPFDSAEAGLEVPFNYRSSYVESVTVSNNVVVVLYGHEAHPVINGKTMTFTVTDTLGARYWVCSAPGIDHRYTGFDIRGDGCVLPHDSPPSRPVWIRHQIESGLALAEDLQDLVEQYYQTNGSWPQSNSEAGAPDPSTILNNYVSSVAVGNGGVISIVYANDVHAAIAGRSVTLMPTDNIGSISWTCFSLGIWRGFLPYQCR